MEKKELIEKLERIITTIETDTDLPLDTKEIYIFGSLLWKDMPRDMAIFMKALHGSKMLNA